MDQRLAVVFNSQRGLYTMTDLCGRYGISRKSGYKWLTRFGDDGPRGLGDRSRAPRTCPHQTPPEVSQLLVAARRANPSWGPRTLLGWLAVRHPALPWPVAIC